MNKIVMLSMVLAALGSGLSLPAMADCGQGNCPNSAADALVTVSKAYANAWRSVLGARCFEDIFNAESDSSGYDYQNYGKANDSVLITTSTPAYPVIAAVLVGASSTTSTGNILSSSNRSSQVQQKIEEVTAGAPDAAEFIAGMKENQVILSQQFLNSTDALLELKAEKYGVDQIDGAVKNGQIRYQNLAQEILDIAQAEASQEN